MTNLNLLQDPRNNPLLRDVERLSPATSLDLVIAYDDEGWGVWECFYIGAIMLDSRGMMWRVIGFTLDNLVIATPHGLGHGVGGKLIPTFVTFKAEGLKHPPYEETLLRHKDSLL